MKFKVNKYGKYYNVIYIDYVTTNMSFDIHYFNNVLFSTRDEVELFLTTFDKVEESIINRLNELSLPYDYKKILRRFLGQVDNLFVSTLDVRYKLPFEDKINLIVGWFDNEYKEADNFCKEVFETVKKFNPPNTDWRTFEKYDRERLIHELPYGSLEPHFGKSLLEEIIDSIENLNDKFKFMKQINK